MRYFLSKDCGLKRLEKPGVYHIKKDELFELDNEAFEFLKKCSGEGGNSDENEFIKYCLTKGIIKKRRHSSVKRPALRKSPVPSLRYLELQITRRCNLRCKHCYIGESATPAIRKSNGTELKAKDIKIILDDFQNMHGLRLLITGGEPLLHSEFSKINTVLADYPFIRKVLFTN